MEFYFKIKSAWGLAMRLLCRRSLHAVTVPYRPAQFRPGDIVEVQT